MNDVFEKVAAKKGVEWEEKLKEWKKNNQWHVEVY
jgi:sulfite reductase alpha subunit-like flavoprotein